MGSGSSVSYKIIDGSATTGTSTKCEWLADSSTRVIPISQEAFVPKKATGILNFDHINKLLLITLLQVRVSLAWYF